MDSLSVTTYSLPTGRAVLRVAHQGDLPSYALTDKALYHWTGNGWSATPLPRDVTPITVSFADDRRGMLVARLANKRSILSPSMLPWILIGIILLGGGYLLYRLIHKKRWKTLFALTSGLLLLGVYVLFPSRKIQRPVTLEFDQGANHYVSASGQPRNGIYLTNDGGKHWRELDLRTNFNVTGVTRASKGYLLSTLANPEHLDGDLWFVSDSGSVGMFESNRALTGLVTTDSNVIAFGSKVSVGFVGRTGMEQHDGQILLLDTGLTRISVIDIPDVSSVKDVAYDPLHHYWLLVTEDGRLLRTHDWTAFAEMSTSQPLSSIRVSTSGIAAGVTLQGQLLLVGDSTQRWTATAIPISQHIRSMEQLDSNQFLLGGDSGYVATIDLR